MQAKQALPPPRPDFSFARPPKSKVSFFFWRWRIWFEATFALTVMEPWEKIVFLVVTFLSVAFFLTAVFKYLPRQIEQTERRSVYYLWGQEGPPVRNLLNRGAMLLSETMLRKI
ncbi:uncharacterized protein BT62DRAFT_1076079 [Guyanagaster necrorhizus]|uniref:Uncharacterized protein n=1 Tax=Guyanagaster necrorhizus TaxID=856835 RepID=A0A9P8ASU3_9AGAR|nr:uncharacterized protein BT62DRAFT_1076079 [Guyanagaster necrorhizus MCA 3950]KAG7446525.1 hypothetical protein BT62DRAFT_1076079 [Guyanagaster necrorhizus MCA 3950]